jgi:Bacteriophage tail sheath protein
LSSEPLDFVPGEADSALDADAVIPVITKTTVAFIGRTERGPLNEAVAIKSFDDYRRIFGGHCAFSFVSFAVQHFFLHGGEAALVVRVANRATRGLLSLPAGGDILRLQARQPGSREYLRASVDYDGAGDMPDRFNLVIQRLGRPGSQLIDDQEFFELLSMDPADERYVVDALHDSELVRLAGPLPPVRPDATHAAHPGEPIPYLGMASVGSDGDELTDYDIIGSNNEGTGLFALDQCDELDLICIPPGPGRDLGATSFVAATRYCERRRALLIWDPPWSWSSPDATILSVRGLARTSQSAVTYFPRVRPRGEFNRYPDGMPASGVVAGVIARCDRNGVWHDLPIADATLKGNLAPLVHITDRESYLLNKHGVNTFVRLQPGVAALGGDVNCAGATSVASLWQKLSASRLVSFVLRSIERHTRWVFNAALDDDLVPTLERQAWIFLSRLQQRGAFAGGSPEQSLFVRASAPRLPRPEEYDDYDVTITLRIGFAPQKPNEFLVYDFRYHERSMTTEVVPVLNAERHLG